MAPPRKHPTDRILDAVRTIVLADGPRAASIATISRASGAPVGTLYHRFGSRDAIVGAAWLRALERFQRRALAAAEAHRDDPVEAGVAIAAAAVALAVEHPDDARLLLAVRRDDLLDRAGGDGLGTRLEAANAPIEAALREIARTLHGTADRRAVDHVVRAVVDLPTAAIRRHLRLPGATLPTWLAGDLAAATRALLESGRR